MVNTSFNVRGEPIVETPLDAVKCFFGTDLDILVLGDNFVRKLIIPITLTKAIKASSREIDVSTAFGKSEQF